MAAIPYSTRFILLFLTAGLFLVAGVSFAETLRHRIDVIDSWIRPPNKQSPDARAFFTIVNHTDQEERLVSVVSPGGEARLLMFHPTLKPYIEELKSIAIPAHGSVTLRPGQFYVALGDSADGIRPGHSLNLSLRFESAGRLDVEAEVSNQLLGTFRHKAPGPSR